MDVQVSRYLGPGTVDNMIISYMDKLKMPLVLALLFLSSRNRAPILFRGLFMLSSCSLTGADQGLNAIWGTWYRHGQSEDSIPMVTMIGWERAV